MKYLTFFKCTLTFLVLSFFVIACNSSEADKKTETTDKNPETTATKPDNQKLKAEIQALETAYANAQNAGDINTVAAFYANDAVTMPNNMPMMSGKDAIKKDLEEGYAKRKGTAVTYDVLDAFGCENYVTEIGKSTRKDSTGKVIYTGKYMALWEKRDGKWICIRDIGNDDEKSKD